MTHSAERKANAEKQLRRRLPKGTTLNFVRIDYGKPTGQKRYYAVIIDEDGKLTNISGHVARFTGMKWSNENKGNHWANSSGVLARNPAAIVEALAQGLYDIWDAVGTDKCFPSNTNL